jgi:hypothetical protein
MTVSNEPIDSLLADTRNLKIRLASMACAKSPKTGDHSTA